MQPNSTRAPGVWHLRERVCPWDDPDRLGYARLWLCILDVVRLLNVSSAATEAQMVAGDRTIQEVGSNASRPLLHSF